MFCQQPRSQGLPLEREKDGKKRDTGNEVEFASTISLKVESDDCSGKQPECCVSLETTHQTGQMPHWKRSRRLSYFAEQLQSNQI